MPEDPEHDEDELYARTGFAVSRQRGSLVALCTISAASGFAGLGYELVWTRMLSVPLGHEIAAVLAVVAAFFVGLGLGARVFGPAIHRSRRPAHWYAALETIVAVWALALGLMFSHLDVLLATAIGAEPSVLRHWFVAFSSTLLLLLPATTAMGASLPALERVFADHTRRRSIPEAYSANTFGAVAGALASTWLLAPRLGFERTLLCFAAVNAGCAFTLLAWVGKRNATPARKSRSNEVTQNAKPHEAIPARRLRATVFLTGFLGLGYEVLVVRVLSQVFENTVYTFASVLSVYLAGTAMGAALMRRASRGRPGAGLETLMMATSLACLLGTCVLWLSPEILDAVRGAFGTGIFAVASAETAVAASVLLLPTLCMGALFTTLADRLFDEAGFGLPLSSNMFGAALAPFCFGVIALPVLGAKVALIGTSAGYLLLIPRAPSRLRLVGTTAAAALLLAVALPSLRFFSVPADGKLIFHRQGVLAAVSVVSDASGNRFLKVNDHFTMGSTESAFSDQREAHLPLLLHGKPKSALFLGVGTGITVNAAKDYPGLSVHAVELLPEVVEALAQFGVTPEAQWASRPRFVVADARRFVLADQEKYDVIVADLFHPSRDGSGALYTRDHFHAVRQRLQSGGLFCQWLPLYQLDAPTLKLIVRTFLAEFPSTQAHLAHYSLQQPILALVGRESSVTHHANWLEDRVHHRALQQRLVALRLNSDFALFGGYLGSEEALASYARTGPLNVDDRPLVTYRAPSLVYGAGDPVSKHLIEFVDSLRDKRGTLVENPVPRRGYATLRQVNDSRFAERLEAYWRARDAFLRAGVGVRPTRDVEGLLAQTKTPLLGVVRLSSDFIPAYAPLLDMAQHLSKDNPTAARALLAELAAANPARPEARLLYSRLFGE